MRRAEEHRSLSAGALAGSSAAASSEEDAELGVRLHPSYPASLEREGFVGGGTGGGSSNGGYAPVPASPGGSPEMELRAVMSSSARDKAGILGSSLGSSLGGGGGSGPLPALLSVTAAAGSSLRRASGGGAAPLSVRTGSAKQKLSPKASSERLDADHLTRQHSVVEGGGEDGQPSSRRRNPSSGGEHGML